MVCTLSYHGISVQRKSDDSCMCFGRFEHLFCNRLWLDFLATVFIIRDFFENESIWLMGITNSFCDT